MPSIKTKKHLSVQRESTGARLNGFQLPHLHAGLRVPMYSLSYCLSMVYFVFEPGHGITNFFFGKSRGTVPRHFAARNLESRALCGLLCAKR
jgi:hypothetical protein